MNAPQVAVVDPAATDPAAAPDRSAEALGPPLPHARDRDAGALGSVPPPPPRVGSFTTPASENLALSRASSTHSVGSHGSVPRSSSFTRSRKFARGDVLSLEDARHVLESNHHTYAGSLKFAAAQQILQEHLPSAPERGEPNPVAPAPPDMPHNEKLAPALRQPGPFPERMPVPLMPIRKPRPPTPPRKKPQPPAHPGAFNIAAPASQTKPIVDDGPIAESDEEEEKKPARRAFARMLSRSMSSKRASAAVSPPKVTVPEPEPKPEAPKKKLRFDDRNPDLHIAVASSASGPAAASASPKQDGADQMVAESDEPKPAKPRFHHAVIRKSKSVAAKKTAFTSSLPDTGAVEEPVPDMPSTRTSLPAGAGRPDVPAPGSADAAPPSLGNRRRLQRARTFFTSLRQSNRGSAEDAMRTPDRADGPGTGSNEPATRTSGHISSDSAEPLSAKSRVRRSSSAAAIIGIRKPFASTAKRSEAKAEDTPVESEAVPDAIPPARKTRAQLPRAASMKVMKFFDNRPNTSPVAEDDGMLRRLESTVGAPVADIEPVPVKKEKKKKHADREEAAIDGDAAAPNSSRPDSVFQSPIRRFSRNASAAAPATDGEPREKTTIQKSIARAQAASASLVARARKLPRSVTIHRFGSRDGSNASSARATPAKPSRASEDVNAKPSDKKPTDSSVEADVISSATKPVLQKTDKAVDMDIDTAEKPSQTRNTTDSKVEIGLAASEKPAQSQKAEAPKVSAVEKSDTVLLPSSTPDNASARAVTSEEGNTSKKGISNAIAMWEKAVKNDTLSSSAAPTHTKDNISVAISENRPANDLGATTKNIPEFVTIKKVIRRKKADGTEEVITKRVRERPTAVRPNGDVVVQRTVRRLKKDGSGEKETVIIEKVIPRRSQSGDLKSSNPAESPAVGATATTAVSSPISINIDDCQRFADAETTPISKGSNISRTKAAEAKKEETMDDGVLREEDWPNRYKSLQSSANAKSTAEKLVREEMNQKDKRVEDKIENVRPGSFGMMQQGLPRGSSFQGQEPYMHDKRRVRLPGAAAYTNVGDMFIESSTRPQRNTDKRSNSGMVRAISRKKAPRLFGKDKQKDKKEKLIDEPEKAEKKGDDAKEVRAAKPLGIAPGDPALTRVMSFEDKRERRSKSHLEANEPVLQTGTSPNNRPGNLPKSSSVGGTPPGSDGRLKTLVTRFKRRFNVPNAAS